MQSAPIPANESERLAILRSYGILDTPPEERFDRITRLVSSLLGVPISLVSLIDTDRQWFKSAVGIDAPQTPRDVAFCAHAILGDMPLVVEDTATDDRFHDNPLVAGDPKIRFYAGAPLITQSGHRLGTLCAIDREPRQLSPREDAMLTSLAAIVIDELELSAASVALEEHFEQIQARNESMSSFSRCLAHDLAGPLRRIRTFSGMVTVDEDSDSQQFLGYIQQSAAAAEDLVRDLQQFFCLDVDATHSECASRDALDGALRELQPDLDEISARVEIDELPVVTVHPTLLTTIFRNLISNAIKYRSERSLRIEIGCIVDGDNDEWEFTVRDNGIGIPAEDQDRVFDLLVRLHSNDRIPGSGMGLPICRRILRKCGGSVRLESAPGYGTVAAFRIPKALAATRA
ncbi:MAG: GAF domain-containing sensor histidine kinase [Planctomycetota bacterium]